MSYQVGQFRRNQLTTYQTQIETGAIIRDFATTVVDDLIVYNSAVALKKDSSSLEKNKIYYINILIIMNLLQCKLYLFIF